VRKKGQNERNTVKRQPLATQAKQEGTRELTDADLEQIQGGASDYYLQFPGSPGGGKRGEISQRPIVYTPSEVVP